MLTLTPQFLVSTATVLASYERQRKTKDIEGPDAPLDSERAERSLRFVHFAGFWSHYTPERFCSSWPLPLSTEIRGLAEFAAQRGGLAESPRAGDVFLLASVRAAGEWNRAGIVMGVETVRTMLSGEPAFVCLTAEGEVYGRAATPRVAQVRLVRRRLSSAFGDRFIRWCDLPSALTTVEGVVCSIAPNDVPAKQLTRKRDRSRRAA